MTVICSYMQAFSDPRLRARTLTHTLSQFQFHVCTRVLPHRIVLDEYREYNARIWTRYMSDMWLAQSIATLMVGLKDNFPTVISHHEGARRLRGQDGRVTEHVLHAEQNTIQYCGRQVFTTAKLIPLTHSTHPLTSPSPPFCSKPSLKAPLTRAKRREQEPTTPTDYCE